jgi:hypothetical protein
MMKALFAIIVVLIVFLLGLRTTTDRWWKKCGDVVVTQNGQSVSNVNVYRSRDGSMLVYMKQGEEMYVIRPENREVGVPNRSNFFILPGYAFSRNAPPLLAPIGKAEINPQMVVERESIEFSSIDNGRIHVSWQSNK